MASSSACQALEQQPRRGRPDCRLRTIAAGPENRAVPPKQGYGTACRWGPDPRPNKRPALSVPPAEQSPGGPLAALPVRTSKSTSRNRSERASCAPMRKSGPWLYYRATRASGLLRASTSLDIAHNSAADRPTRSRRHPRCWLALAQAKRRSGNHPGVPGQPGEGRSAVDTATLVIALLIALLVVVDRVPR